LRKRDQIMNDNNYQLQATVLVDVCFRIFGEVWQKNTSTRGKDCAQARTRRGRDWRLRMWELFQKRLTSGQTYYTPCLGWKEFVPSYFGSFRERDEHDRPIGPDRDISLVIPSLLHSMWEHRRLKPVFKQDWHIVNGAMSYEHQEPFPEVQDA
jgi:CRISPR-associated protein Cas5d